MPYENGASPRRHHSLLDIVAVAIATLALFATFYQGYVTRDTEVRQLRAYVIVSSNELENFGEGNIGHVQGQFENLGQTPVYNATWSSGINVAPLNVSFTYSPCTEIIDKQKEWSFGKLAHPDKDRDRAFSAGEIKSVQEGVNVVFFNGRVCYRDIFRKVRHTDFCIHWAWKNGSLGPAVYCDRGNDAE